MGKYQVKNFFAEPKDVRVLILVDGTELPSLRVIQFMLL